MANEQASGLLAVLDGAGTPAAGAIIWWRLQGGVELERLRAAWEAEGLETAWLPSAPGPSVALTRAVNELRDTHRLVRSLPKGAGHVVKLERARKDVDGNVVDLDYDTDMRVALDKVGRVQVTPAWHDDAAKVTELFDRYQRELVQADVSPWLCRLVDKLSAVALRDTGGIYFVPRFELPTWERIVRALRAATAHTVSNVPAMRSEEAVRAIADAVSVEAEAEFESIMRQLEDGELGERAIENRVELTRRIEGKVLRYEELLGEKLEKLHARAEELRASLSVAAIKVDQARAADARPAALASV